MSLRKNFKEKLKQIVRESEYLDDKIEKSNKVFFDKKCPICDEVITDSYKFCRCGYFLEKEKNKKIVTVVLFTWFFIIAFSLVIYNNFYSMGDAIKSFSAKKESDFSSVSPDNVRIITSLSGTKYYDYVENIYVNSQDTNKLAVFIKPVYWNILSENEKKDILLKIKKEWEKIYIQNNPKSEQKPEVYFVNI